MTKREMYLVAGICMSCAALVLFLRAVSISSPYSIVGAGLATLSSLIWFGLYNGVLGEEDSEEDTEEVSEE